MKSNRCHSHIRIENLPMSHVFHASTWYECRFVSQLETSFRQDNFMWCPMDLKVNESRFLKVQIFDSSVAMTRNEESINYDQASFLMSKIHLQQSC